MNKAMEKLSAKESTLLRRDMIGFIFQNFNLIESWTALENVEAALAHKRLSKSALRDGSATILAELRLGDRLENFPRELSMGEAQRVAVARTLVKEPLLVLADEPTGSVDPETGDEIARRLTAHARERGACLVVATHGAFPLESADTIWRLENGRLRRS
jgi:putative ABC transport system ATP-binding protein